MLFINYYIRIIEQSLPIARKSINGHKSRPSYLLNLEYHNLKIGFFGKSNSKNINYINRTIIERVDGDTGIECHDF